MKFSKAQAKQQQADNEYCLLVWNDAMSYFDECIDTNPARIKWIRLNNCQAWYCNIDRYTYLKSYNTIIAVFDDRFCRLFDMRRYVYGYTSTSAQHIAKFRNEVQTNYHLMWNEISEYRYYEV